MRRVTLLGVLAGSAVLGLAAASVVTGDPPARPVDATHDDARPGTTRVLARSDDPDGGPDWIARAYDGQTGLRCIVLARTDGRRVGRATPDGRVEELPVDDSGSCAEPDAASVQLALARIPHGGGLRGVLFGALDPERVTSIVVRSPDGRAHRFASRPAGIVAIGSGTGSWHVTISYDDGAHEAMTF